MVEYVRNRVFYSPLTGNFYFARKAKVLNAAEGAYEVVGSKIDVSASVAPLVEDAVRFALRKREVVQSLKRAVKARKKTKTKKRRKATS